MKGINTMYISNHLNNMKAKKDRSNMKVVIMAGGRGTRISSIASDIPKPMIQIEGKPVLERQIECLRDYGLKEFIITISYLGQVIVDYFGDGNRFGVNIEYYFEKEPLGNAGALLKIKDKLSDVFILINGDVIFDIDFDRFIEFHNKKNGLVTLLTHPNSHPYDSGLIITDEDGSVTKWINKEEARPNWYKNRVNAGLHIINKKILEISYDSSKVDLDRQLLKPLQGTHKMFAYDSPEYVKDMGTPDRYYSVCSDFKKGVIQRKNLKYKQKAIFLDRDGTINRYSGFLKNINDFHLIDGVAEAIKKINCSGYLCIVITNQPVIARGELTYTQLNEIHNKMETLLGKDGAYIDALYFCPHHPDSGYEGEIIELKINCDCRKPKPGLLIRAAKDYNIDLTKSYMIGDGKNDVLAGKNAGCQTIILGEGCEVEANYKCKDLLESINMILKKQKI